MVEERICSKCGKTIEDKSKFCPSCGGRVVDKEEHRVKEVKKRKLLLYVLIPSITILLIAAIVIFVVPFPYKAVEGYDVQEPYAGTEYYYENEPYQGTEYYTTTENGGGCDKDTNCYCLHKSWFGLGACDSCSCTRTRTVTKYQQVQKSRTVTEYRTLYKEREVLKQDTLFNMWTGKTKYYYKV